MNIAYNKNSRIYNFSGGKMNYLGESFAFITAVGWAVSSIIFELAAKRSDSLSVNVIRLIMGIVFLGIITLFTKGMFLPMDSTAHNWTFLGISGAIGLFIGDMFLYEAYVLIGARICMLFMTLTPLIVGSFGFIILGEKMTLIQTVAMFITCSGILMVVLKPKNKNSSEETKLSSKGILFIILAVTFEALGNIFTKIGSAGYDSSSSTQIRMICAFGVFIVYITLKRRWKHIFRAFSDRKLMIYIAGGTISATVGITFLVSAFNMINTGVASTISSISPVLVIPISMVVFKEKIKVKEIIGAFVSVAGIALFFL